jgi:hypothetical protein
MLNGDFFFLGGTNTGSLGERRLDQPCPISSFDCCLFIRRRVVCEGRWRLCVRRLDHPPGLRGVSPQLERCPRPSALLVTLPVLLAADSPAAAIRLWSPDVLFRPCFIPLRSQHPARLPRQIFRRFHLAAPGVSAPFSTSCVPDILSSLHVSALSAFARAARLASLLVDVLPRVRIRSRAGWPCHAVFAPRSPRHDPKSTSDAVVSSSAF